MAQVRKLQGGGNTRPKIRIHGFDFDKQEFTNTALLNQDAYLIQNDITGPQADQFKQELANFAQNGQIGESSMLNDYFTKLVHSGAVTVPMDKPKPKYSGNDFLLNEYILPVDYAGDADQFSNYWQNKLDEKGRISKLSQYLGTAASGQNFDNYDFSKTKYKDQASLNAALQQLSEGLADGTLDTPDYELANSLGIDLDKWINPQPKAPKEPTREEKQAQERQTKIDSYLNQGYTQEQAERLVQREESTLNDQRQATLDALDQEDFVNDYNTNAGNLNTFYIRINPDSSSWKDYDLHLNYLHTDGEKNAYIQSHIDKVKNAFAQDGGYGRSLNNVDWNAFYWAAKHISQDYILLSTYVNNPYSVVVFDKNSGEVRIMGVFNPALDNIYPIDKYREYYVSEYNKQKGTNIKIPSRKEGGVIKYQQGGYTYIYNLNQDANANNDELSDSNEETSSQIENYAQDTGAFDFTDYMHMTAAAADLAALGASFAGPGGAMASLVSGIASAVLDTGADFANVFKGNMSLGSALFNTASGVGMAFLGMFPGVKQASILQKAAKWAPRIMATLSAMDVTPTIINAFDKVQKGEQLNREDWLSIAQGVKLLALGARDARGSYLTRKYSNKTYEVGLSSGKTAKLNADQMTEFRKLNTDDERTNYLRSINQANADEKVARNVFGYGKLKTSTTNGELMTSEEVTNRYGSITPGYSYIYELNHAMPWNSSKIQRAPQQKPVQDSPLSNRYSIPSTPPIRNGREIYIPRSMEDPGVLARVSGQPIIPYNELVQMMAWKEGGKIHEVIKRKLGGTIRKYQTAAGGGIERQNTNDEDITWFLKQIFGDNPNNYTADSPFVGYMDALHTKPVNPSEYDKEGKPNRNLTIRDAYSTMRDFATSNRAKTQLEHYFESNMPNSPTIQNLIDIVDEYNQRRLGIKEAEALTSPYKSPGFKDSNLNHLILYGSDKTPDDYGLKYDETQQNILGGQTYRRMGVRYRDYNDSKAQRSIPVKVGDTEYTVWVDNDGTLKIGQQYGNQYEVDKNGSYVTENGNFKPTLDENGEPQMVPNFNETSENATTPTTTSTETTTGTTTPTTPTGTAALNPESSNWLQTQINEWAKYRKKSQDSINNPDGLKTDWYGAIVPALEVGKWELNRRNNNRNKELLMQTEATLADPTHEVAPQYDEYSKVREAEAARQQIINSGKANSSNPWINSAASLEAGIKAANVDTSLSSARSQIREANQNAAIAAANNNAKAEVTTANANRERVAAISNAKRQLEAQFNNANTTNDINLVNMFINRANDALTLRNSQIEKGRANKLALENYENISAIYSDRAAAQTQAWNEWIAGQGKDVPDANKQSEFTKYWNQKYEPVYQRELAYRQNFPAIFSARQDAASANNIFGNIFGVTRVPDTSNIRVPQVYMGSYGSWTPPTYNKKGGSLTYDEKLALQQNKQAWKSEENLKRRNHRRQLQADKIQRNSSDKAFGEIYKLINKALGV